MSPALFEADLLERRRQMTWRRLARPDAPAVAAADPTSEPYALGYPHRSPLLRALVPIALAILLFLAYGPSRSGSAAPRPAASERSS